MDQLIHSLCSRADPGDLIVLPMPSSIEKALVPDPLQEYRRLLIDRDMVEVPEDACTCEPRPELRRRKCGFCQHWLEGSYPVLVICAMLSLITYVCLSEAVYTWIRFAWVGGVHVHRVCEEFAELILIPPRIQHA